MPSTGLVLTTEQRTELETRARSRRGRADAARRARVILQLAAGETYASITVKTGCSSRTIALWKHRFEADGIAGLSARHLGSKPTVLTPELQARILAWTRRTPPHGATHWSTRSLGRKLGVQHTIVARAWRDAGLQPHRLERYMRSTDPDFETKAADVIGLYLDPPQHAVVFCVDEKTAIQALDRIDPMLPLSPGRAERHGFEYYRHGTLSLYAALNTHTGEVVGSAVPRHTSEEFVAFLQSVVDRQPRRRAIHIIVDNLSAHKTQKVRTFLAAQPTVRLHYTPTYSSWLNQVELWFSKIERDVIARGIFTSVPDLRRKLLRYIKHYNKTAKPFRWSYTDPTRRIA
ncbi:MAG TPA: IS630 family transposase [Gemmatimonadaceae bacterium]